MQDLDDDGVRLPDGLADQFLGQAAGGAFGVIEAAGGIDRAVGLDAVLPADDVVFLAVAGGGVDGAGALFERDVVGQDAEGIAFQKGMAEDGVLRARAGKRARTSESAQPHFSAVTLSRSAATM